MRRRSLVVFALLALTRWAQAFGSTQESWLGGTQPWDSVPYFEMNVGVHGSGGDGRPQLGPLVELGLHDQIMVACTWDQPLDSAPGSGDLMLKLREAEFPRWRPALAIYARTGLGTLSTDARAGLVLGIEPWDHSLALNLETGPGGLGARLGYWTPYLVSFVRVGFEGVLPDPNSAWRLLPQVALEAMGDVSAVLGAQTLSDGSGRWTALIRFSYQFFPSP